MLNYYSCTEKINIVSTSRNGWLLKCFRYAYARRCTLNYACIQLQLNLGQARVNIGLISYIYLGLLSINSLARPTVGEVFQFRQLVTAARPTTVGKESCDEQLFIIINILHSQTGSTHVTSLTCHDFNATNLCFDYSGGAIFHL